MNDIPQTPSSVPSSVHTDPSQTTVRLDPVTSNFVIPVPWYKRVFSSPVTRTQTVWKLTFLSLIVVGIIVGQQSMQTPTNTITQASVGKAHILLFPQTTEMPPDKSFQLWVKTDTSVKESTIVLTFDPSILQLSRDVTLISQAGYQLLVTPTQEANQTGSIKFMLIPESRASAIPEGTFQLGSFFMKSNNNTSQSSTVISVNDSQSRIVNPDNIPLSLSTTNIDVSLK